MDSCLSAGPKRRVLIVAILLNGMIIGQLQVYGLARVVVTMAAVVPPTAGSTDRMAT